MPVAENWDITAVQAPQRMLSQKLKLANRPVTATHLKVAVAGTSVQLNQAMTSKRATRLDAESDRND